MRRTRGARRFAVTRYLLICALFVGSLVGSLGDSHAAAGTTPALEQNCDAQANGVSASDNQAPAIQQGGDALEKTSISSSDDQEAPASQQRGSVEDATSVSESDDQEAPASLQGGAVEDATSISASDKQEALALHQGDATEYTTSVSASDELEAPAIQHGRADLETTTILLVDDQEALSSHRANEANAHGLGSQPDDAQVSGLNVNAEVRCLSRICPLSLPVSRAPRWLLLFPGHRGTRSCRKDDYFCRSFGGRS